MLKVRVNNDIVRITTAKGKSGLSAYEYAVKGGFIGTEQEFVNALLDNISEGENNSNGHDYSQNNENASSYIKNRTHWVESDGDPVTYLEELEVDLSANTVINDIGNVIVFIREVDTNFLNSLVVGDSYTLTINGNKYTNTYKYLYSNDGGYFGDACKGCAIDYNMTLEEATSEGYISTGEPYFIRVHKSSDITQIGITLFDELYDADLTSITLSITNNNIIYHTIDDIYIPDKFARKTYLDSKISAAIG